MNQTFEKITKLELKEITKSFPGVLANDHITFTVNENEILALVGENGSGKTTLMNIVMGLYKQDSGDIFINGEKVKFTSPEDAVKCGIGMVHQTYMLVPNMTVAENIALGMEDCRYGLKKLNFENVRKKALEISEKYSLKIDLDAYIWQLSVGEQQKVELVKTLCCGAKFLILDEPTSALTPQETDELIALLKVMSSEMSIIFISHKLYEVTSLCHKICVLRHGKLVYMGDTKDSTVSEIATHMTGKVLQETLNTSNECTNPIVFELKDLVVKNEKNINAVDHLNLQIKAGEIMGLAGISGNGQKELAQAINGLRKIESGTYTFFGQDLKNKTVREIIDAGMGYIPEERNIEGIVPPMSIKENLILKDCDEERFSKRGLLNDKLITDHALKMINEFDIRGGGINVPAGSLSGGNIQKVILAREIERNPKFLTCVYPIRGLDLGAVHFIHKQLLELKKKEIGILLISEELDEILQMSDRIAVIFEGKIERILLRSEANKTIIGELMGGVNRG